MATSPPLRQGAPPAAPRQASKPGRRKQCLVESKEDKIEEKQQYAMQATPVCSGSILFSLRVAKWEVNKPSQRHLFVAITVCISGLWHIRCEPKCKKMVRCHVKGCHRSQKKDKNHHFFSQPANLMMYV